MNFLIISPWSYNDALTVSYVLPYLRLINQEAELAFGKHCSIYVVTWEMVQSNSLVPSIEVKHHLSTPFYHVPLFFPRKIISNPLSFVGTILLLLRIFLFRHIDFIQSWCTTGAFWGFFLSKIFGIPLILDSFEPHADPMVECGIWKRSGFKYRFLKYIETKAARRAIACLPVTKYMYNYTKLTYGLDITIPSAVKPACVQDSYFPSQDTLSLPGSSSNSLNAIYIGKFGGLYLDIDFFRILKCGFELWPDNFNVQILSCQPLPQIDKIAQKVNFDLNRISIQCVPHQEIPSFLQASDFAILPLKSVPSRLCCTPVKTGEYWSHGLPILATRGISTDSEVIKKYNIGVVLPDLSDFSIKDSLIKMKQLVLDARGSTDLSQKIQKVAHNYRGFHIASASYKSIYNQLKHIVE